MLLKDKIFYSNILDQDFYFVFNYDSSITCNRINFLLQIDNENSLKSTISATDDIYFFFNEYICFCLITFLNKSFGLRCLEKKIFLTENKFNNLEFKYSYINIFNVNEKNFLFLNFFSI
jgi:hypothetical protein